MWGQIPRACEDPSHADVENMWKRWLQVSHTAISVELNDVCSCVSFMRELPS